MSRSIFIVEDDQPVRALLREHLTRRGHDVVVARDAETLVASLLRRPSLDVIIADIHLPGISGLDLLRLVQGHSPMKPVLLITGDDDEELARRALRNGASGYLLKPFELFELDAVLGQAIERLSMLERADALDPTTGRRADPELAVPMAWLEIADERSGAGHGHGPRVERLARTLLKQADLAPGDGRVLGDAARLHELARLLAVDVPDGEIPARTAAFLEDSAVPDTVCETIAGMSAPWNGGGRSADLERGSVGTPSLALGAADAVDHAASRLVAEGELPPTAIMHALEELTGAGEDRFGPALTETLSRDREVLSAIWILGRGGYGPPEPMSAS